MVERKFTFNYIGDKKEVIILLKRYERHGKYEID